MQELLDNIPASRAGLKPPNILPIPKEGCLGLGCEESESLGLVLKMDMGVEKGGVSVMPCFGDEGHLVEVMGVEVDCEV